MRAKNIYFLIALSLILIEACNSTCTNNDEVEAKKFVEQTSVKLNDFYEKINNKVLSFKDELPENVQKAIVSLMEIVASNVVTVNESKAFCYSKFKDAEVKRIFEILNEIGEDAVIGTDKYFQLMLSVVALKRMTTDKDIPSYRNASVSLAYNPDIRNVFTMSKDPEELKFYWTAWREKNNKFGGNNFRIVIERVREAAEITGMTPSEYWLKGFNISEMETTMIQLKPLYMQMHAFIRSQLNKKYGDQVMKPTGPIPGYLLEQVLIQSWTDKSVIDDFYPIANLPPYSSMIRAIYNFDASKQYRVADNFYRSLGFEPIPERMWGTQLKMKQVENADTCETAVFDSTSNVHLLYCPKIDFRKFLQAHGYMGRIYYAREKANLPGYYLYSYDLEHSVENAVMLSASSPKYLNKIGISNDVEYSNEMFMNRLLRMAIHVLTKVPAYFVHSKFMVDLLNDTFDISEHNKYYWELMHKYMGVVPPDNRAADAFDFPYIFYDDINEHKQAVKFYSEILGYQFYKRLCEISGQSDLLQNCDFYGSKDAGNALKKMMKLGSSKTYDDVLATLLNYDPIISADGLMEYYLPVMKWLTEQNAKAQVEIDWTN